MRKSRRRRGFSLIEVMLAVGLLAAAFVAFFPVFSQSLTFTKEIRDYSVLISLAEEIIHDYIVKIDQNAGGSPLSFLEEDITATVKTEYPNDLYAKFKDFQVLATVRPSVLCESGGYEIAAKINWTVEGKKKTYSLFTLKAVKK